MPMKERTKNMAVGITVLLGIAFLGFMILLFAGLPEVFKRGYEIKMLFKSTSEVRENDPVHLSGMSIGRVRKVEFTDGDPRKGVTFVARIDWDISIPANAKPFVYTRGLVGGAYLTLIPEGEYLKDPETGKVMDFLPKDKVITLKGTRKGSGAFPKELKDALKGLSDLASNLNKLIAPETQPAVEPKDGEKPIQPDTGLKSTVTKLNRALDALYAVLGDTENQENIKSSLANLSEASEKGAEAMEALKDFATQAKLSVEEISVPASSAAKRFDELAQKLIESAENVSALMTNLNQAATKIEAGEGTAGKFINDPKLYNSLLDATNQMSDLLEEFRDLVEQWKQRGVEIKMKS